MNSGADFDDINHTLESAEVLDASARPNELAARLFDLRAGGTTAHMIIDQTH
jgi:hypothetical protein